MNANYQSNVVPDQQRADRRPQGWDLNLSLVRKGLDDADFAVIERQFPGLRVRLAAAAQSGTDGQAEGAQWSRPVDTGSEPVDNWPGAAPGQCMCMSVGVRTLLMM
jgi:hypothetical protein